MSETMTSVLHDLCTQLDQAQQALRDEQQQHGYTQARLTTAEAQGATSHARAQQKAQELLDSQSKLSFYVAREPKTLDNLNRLDRMSLALYHLMVELAGHRDTAKTKAERIALGHVVERLKEIRPLNDAEAKEIG